MNSDKRDTLCTTFLEVVEHLTFMFGEIVAKQEMPLGGRDFTLARMSFAGDLAGRLAVAVPADIKGEIAANILGLDPDDLQCRSMMDDALAEMLNVVCGHVIMALAGAGANFKLVAPETLELEAENVASMVASDDFVGFMLDENPVFLGLSLED